VKSPVGQSDQISCNVTALQRAAPRCNAWHHVATRGTTLAHQPERLVVHHEVRLPITAAAAPKLRH
jgi:hypothetical protein